MKNLSEIIVCSVCGGELSSSVEGQLCCDDCGRNYSIRNNIYHMLPESPPNELSERWKLWKQVQHNGEVSYNQAPEINLSNDDDAVVVLFRQRAGLDKRVLDIGCGPQQDQPVYINVSGVKEYVGIDPIEGSSSRDFSHVQGIGECLPFRPDSFDHVVMFSSLDHMLDYPRALREANRVLLTGGCIHILADQMDEDNDHTDGTAGFLHLVTRGFRQVMTGLSTMGLKRTIRYVITMLSLKVPDGAKDYFHTQFPSLDEIRRNLEASGFELIEEIPVGDEVLINARKYRHF
jgi:ubiquinone/menaquinone biosynthesis C-methylase UbiE/uncharacterized protein YbaR (Trm112 family)